MKSDTRAFYQRAIQRVIAQLVTQLDASADLHQLAQLAGLSPFHFHRVFRGMVGETPLELLRRLRLERAAWTLLHTGDAVTRVAFAAGYETHESFTRAFRVSFGTTPSDFRRTAHGRASLATTSGIHFRPDGVVTDFIPRNTGGETMHVETETLPPLRLAVVPHLGPYNQIGSAFETLAAIAGRAGLLAMPGAMMVAAYHRDPDATPVNELRSDAGVSLPDAVPLPEGLEEVRIPGGVYARHAHIGRFDLLGDVWSRFMGEGIPARGLQLADGPALEIYRSDMRSTPPDQFHTDLLAPVR